ncbi:helix-turn-helix domain-containing protein [Plantactinospora sonchi]|uniref:helix-turn-helix domain-containing protein n=1 Tax=Plantactinospora sonchi TaxID=1544735 RepID=UPI0038B555B5
MRARIILACARGLSNSEVSRLVGVSLPTVGTWRSRFVVHRVDGLYDEPVPFENSVPATRPAHTR